MIGDYLIPKPYSYYRYFIRDDHFYFRGSRVEGAFRECFRVWVYGGSLGLGIEGYKDDFQRWFIGLGL